MTLADFATISTAVSGLAVTASLIYLALQTHQNAKHTRALIHQGRVAALRDVFLASAQTDIATSFLVMTGAPAGPRDVQQRQYYFVLGAMFYGWQDTYLQYRNGLLDDDFFRQMKQGVTSILQDPAARQAWASYRVEGTAFAAFVDGIVGDLERAEAG